MAERTGLEPATPGVTGRYSNRLNYRSMKSVGYCLLLTTLHLSNSPLIYLKYSEYKTTENHDSCFVETVVGAERIELPTNAV